MNERHEYTRRLAYSTEATDISNGRCVRVKPCPICLRPITINSFSGGDGKGSVEIEDFNVQINWGNGQVNYCYDCQHLLEATPNVAKALAAAFKARDEVLDRLGEKLCARCGALEELGK